MLDDSSNNSALIMPTEFDIEFRSGDAENERISKVATCILASCDIDYGPVGEFITFSGYSDPIAISLSMTFTEIEPLSRGMISKGF